MKGTTKRSEFPGATKYADRHGATRWRYRVGLFSRELGKDYGSPEFVRRYEAAVQQKNAPIGIERERPGSLASLVSSFKAGKKYQEWSPATRRSYGGTMEWLRENFGPRLIADLQTHHVEAIMSRKASTPAAANRIRKVLAMLLDHAIKVQWRTDNPARPAELYNLRRGGWHTWTEAEIAQFMARHPSGTLAHTAMTLMLYTGAARVDAVQLGWTNVRGNRLHYRRQKTRRYTSDDESVPIPIHEELAEVLCTLPRDAGTFLATRTGAMRSPNGLGNAMRRWCDEAGLPECSSHGLRKACARRLADAGATTHEIAAVTGHATLAEVERYTRQADRVRLADAGFAKLVQPVPAG